MKPLSKRFWSCLIALCLLVAILPSSVSAQLDPIPVPTPAFGGSGSLDQPTGGAGLGNSDGLPRDNTQQIVLQEDFEAGLTRWLASDTQIIAAENSNHVAQLTTLVPASFPALTDYDLTVWFNLAGNADARIGAQPTLRIEFSGTYTLDVSAAGLTLADASGTTLATQAAVIAPKGWQTLDLNVRGESITASVNQQRGMAYQITTRQGNLSSRNPLALLKFASISGSVQLDDVLVVNRESKIVVVPPVREAPDSAVRYNAVKLSSELVQLIDTYNQNGNVAEVASSFTLTFDGKSRLQVEVWAESGITGERLATVIEAAGGKIMTVDYTRVSAMLDLSTIAALSLADEVSVIHITPRLSASDTRLSTFGQNLTVADIRDPQGPVEGEGFDMTGVQSWHLAGFTGANISVAIIDIGFGDPNTGINDDMNCHAFSSITLSFGSRAANDTNRGLQALEVICDVAPDAEVRLYKATTMDTLNDAIEAATTDNSRLIVVNVDFGPNVSPGDGTLGYGSAKNPYAALEAARDDGSVIIAAAGNSRQSYTTFELPSATNVTIPMTVRPGTAVNLGWNDWDSNQNGGATREDFNATLSGGGFANINKPARGTSNPGHQFTVPTSCTTDGNGFCSVSLAISGLTGDTSIVQVQASGVDSTFGTVTGVTPFDDFGTLARPGDSPDVITVGAFCASTELNFQSTSYTSRGPVYLPGGNFATLPSVPFFTADEVKPDFIGAAHVSTSFGFVNDPTACNSAFAGSQAGAAHFAGQVAVLFNNPIIDPIQSPDNPAQLTTAVLQFMRTHAFDMPFGANANGYDMRHGAGVAVLGDPTFDPDELPNPNTFIVPNRVPAGECGGGFIYVGPYNVGASNMDGTLQRPFTHIGHGMAVASEQPDRCVIVLPGEYSSPVYANGFTNPTSVYGYASVIRNAAPPSLYRGVNSYTKLESNFFKYGMVYVDEIGFTFSGFNFAPNVIYGGGNTVEPNALIVDGATDVVFSNNTIEGFYTSDGIVQIVDGSQSVAITGNRFINNQNLVEQIDQTFIGTSLTLVSTDGAGAPGTRILIDRNLFQDNRSNFGVWVIENLPPDGVGATVRSMGWTSLVRIVDSYVDLNSNVFRDNEVESMVEVVTREKVSAHETRILGNVFVNNTMNTLDGLGSGPLIQLFFAQRIYIVNNTFARNDFITSGLSALLVGRGDEILDNFNEVGNNNNSGSLGSTEARWEFHNNFIMENGADIVDEETGAFSFNPTALSILNDMEAPGVGCTDLSNQTDKGAQYNWLWKAAIGQGVCGPAFADPSNNNIPSSSQPEIDPYPRDEFYNPLSNTTRYIFGGAPADRFNPAYYSLSRAILNGVEDLVAEPDGVDDGFDSFVTTNLPEFAAGFDARNVIRRNDGDEDGDVDPVQIDIGGYEFTLLELESPIEVTFNEDEGPVTVEINSDYLEGGFPPFTVTITRYPDYYGVSGVDGSNCDARFTLQAQGVVVEYLTDGTPVITYCPPPDFHTESTSPGFVPAGASLDFNLQDGSNSIAPSTIIYTVTQVNDSLLATTLGDNNPAGDILDEAVAIGRDENADSNQFKLRPFVDFSDNFFFSERDNAIEPTAQDEVDYDFTYTTPTLLADPGNVEPNFIFDNMVVIDLAAGLIGIDLSTATPPTGGFAQAKLQYTVTDRNGGSVNNIVTVRALYPPGDFDQLTPPDLTQFPSAELVDIFTWESATNTEDYYFELIRTSGAVNETILDLSELTPADDSDGLLCDTATCTFELDAGQQAAIGSGVYEWTVTADNQGVTTVAGNAPLTFTVSIGLELLKNGSFEIQGETKNEALHWDPKNVDNDKRKCNKDKNGDGIPDKIFSYEADCAYVFKALDGVKSKIQQSVENFGDSGDNLTFSFYASTKNLSGGGVGTVKIKYPTATKEKISLDINTGTNVYQQYGDLVTLPEQVLKAKVLFQSKNGSGKFNVDLASLVLETGPDFDLLTPVNGEDYTSADDLSVFTWEVSVGAVAYDVLIELSSVVNTPVIDLEDLTNQPGDDELTCYETVCRLVLSPAQQDLLTGGNYRWQVTSKGGFITPANNGPYFFSIETDLTELVLNGGFEFGDGTLPDDWKDKNIGGSKLKCNKPADNEYPAYQGICSFQFKGAADYNGKLQQTVTGSVSTGDVLILSAVVSGSKVKVDEGKIEAKIKYTNGDKDKLTLNVPGDTYTYTLLTANLTIANDVDKIKVAISYKGNKGSFMVDNVRLLQEFP